MDRRTALLNLSSLGAAVALGTFERADAEQSADAPRARHLRKIATEEACTIPEVATALRDVVRAGGRNLDLPLLAAIYDAPAAIQPRFLPELLDLDTQRPADMDRHGVQMHLLALTAPGVQMFDAETGASLATVANDRLAEVVRRHPTRYAALASFAPQDPSRAVQEMERAIRTLKFNGFMVNSHTNNEYLDRPRYWPILEAAEALDAPLYIHPRAPSDGMAEPFRDYRLEGAAWGYGLETGTHAVRLMLSGVLDRFPRLRIVIGHMGEALPFWMWRLDFMAAPGARAAGRRNQLKPSEYFSETSRSRRAVSKIRWRFDTASTKSDPITSCGRLTIRISPLVPRSRSSSRHRYPRWTGNRLPGGTRSESSASMHRIEPGVVGYRDIRGSTQ